MKRTIAWVSVGLFLLLSTAEAQQLPLAAHQEQIAAQLRSEDISTISQGIGGASRIPYQEWTPELREAILYALEMEKLRDAEAARQGRHRFIDDNLSAPLARLAVVTQDPAAIPLLVQVHGIGAVRAALVAFGRLALPDLIRVVKDGGFDEAISCMITLRQLVQVKGVDYFTDAERAKLKLLVSLFLVPGDPMVRDDLSKRITMKRAVQLALVLDDAEAREWVQDIASSNDLYQAKTGSQYPEYYRGLLQEMLDGATLLPEPRPLSEYFETWAERGEYGVINRSQ